MNFNPATAADALLDESNGTAFTEALASLRADDNPAPPARLTVGALTDPRTKAAITKAYRLALLIEEVDARLTAGGAPIGATTATRLDILRQEVDSAFGPDVQVQRPGRLNRARADLLITFHGSQVHALGTDPLRNRPRLPVMVMWQHQNPETIFERIDNLSPGMTATDQVAVLVSELTPLSPGNNAETMAAVARRYLDAPTSPTSHAEYTSLAAARTVTNLMLSGHSGAQEVVKLIEGGMLGNSAFREGLGAYFAAAEVLHYSTYDVVEHMLETDSRLALAVTDTATPPRLLQWLSRTELNARTAFIVTRLLNSQQFLPEGTTALVAEPLRLLGDRLRDVLPTSSPLPVYSAVKPCVKAVLDDPTLNDPQYRLAIAHIVANYWPESADEMSQLIQVESSDRPHEYSAEIGQTLTAAMIGGAHVAAQNLGQALDGGSPA